MGEWSSNEGIEGVKMGYSRVNQSLMDLTPFCGAQQQERQLEDDEAEWVVVIVMKMKVDRWIDRVNREPGKDQCGDCTFVAWLIQVMLQWPRRFVFQCIHIMKRRLSKVDSIQFIVQ